MAVIRVPTSFNIDVEFEIPEFYRRLISFLIDVVVEYIYLRIVEAIIQGQSGSWGRFDENLEALWLIFVIPFLLYHLMMEVLLNGQSIGKKIMGIRVVNENGGRPGFSQFVIRWLMRISDLWMLILLALLAKVSHGGWDTTTVIVVVGTLLFLVTDIALVVVTKKSQRLGDILAKTMLININTKSNIEDTVFMEVADSYVPQFPQIMQLTDKDINAIKSILETARKKGDYDMAEAASAKIRKHLKIETTVSPFDFLEALLKDYNYLSTK